MGKTNIVIVVGVRRDGGLDVLHLGIPSELPSVLPKARRMHEEYSEIRTFSSASMIEKTRSDLPDIADEIGEVVEGTRSRKDFLATLRDKLNGVGK